MMILLVVAVAFVAMVAQAEVNRRLVKQIEDRNTHERRILVNRILARSVEQAAALDNPDAFLAANQVEPVRRLTDATGLLEVELDDED